MTHHAVSILLRFLAGFVAGLAVLAGFGVWLLSRGPISLDAVAPYIAWTMSRGTGVTVTIDHTSLSLGGGGRIRVLARGVHLQRESGAAVLTLTDLALDFSPRAALTGVIAPTRIIINEPELRLERSADGRFHFAIGDVGADSAEDWGQKLIGDLVRPPDRQGALGYLTEVLVQHARFTVEDRALGIEWHAADADASLRRASDRTQGIFHIVSGEGPGETRLEGDYTFLPSASRLVVRLGFEDIEPSRWANAAPALANLAAIAVPISGELRAEFDPTRLTLRDAIANLSIGKGVLHHPIFVDGVLAIAGAKLQGGYDAVAGRINLGLFSLDLAPGILSVSGAFDGVGSELLSGGQPQAVDMSLAIAAQGLKLDDFPHLWPEKANPSTQRWVTQHLKEGTVEHLDAKLGLHLDLAPDAAKPASLRELDGNMSFTGLAVEYFRPLPPVKQVAGTAHFDGTEIEFRATTGDLGTIHASSAIARFYQLDTHDEQAKITVTAQGPLAEALGVLDTAPYYYAREIGLDPKRTGGDFSAQLTFAFPLLDHLPLDAVFYGANATLNNVALGSVMFGRDLSDGALSLKLDPSAAQIDGTAQLAGTPLDVSWRQSLQEKAAVRAHYRVKARLDDAQRKALGLAGIADMIAGPVAIDATYDIAANKRAKALAMLDLKEASLDIKKLNLTKPAGTPAMAQVALDLVDEKVTSIREASLKGTGLDAKAAVSFDDQGGVSAVTIDHLIAGDNDFHGRFSHDAARGWQVELQGKSFDASGLIDDLDKAPSEGTEPPLSVTADLGRLRLGPDREARAFLLTLQSDGTHWREAQVDLKLSDKGAAQLRYSSEGERLFTLTSDDFGALLKLLDIFGDIQGGRFSLTGRAVDRDGRRILVAKADGGDYRVVRAPTLARLLSLASFSGISALLTGQGIPFNRLQGDVEISTGKISLANARAYGGAIGINASGLIDRAARQLNISGTLAPAYTLNSVIGDIPVLDILVGGQGQGLFASNFRLYGSYDEPQISVNALSTLAPGVLRNLFLFSPSGP